jgi:hypothetical protein
MASSWSLPTNFCACADRGEEIKSRLCGGGGEDLEVVLYRGPLSATDGEADESTVGEEPMRAVRSFARVVHHRGVFFHLVLLFYFNFILFDK